MSNKWRHNYKKSSPAIAKLLSAVASVSKFVGRATKEHDPSTTQSNTKAVSTRNLSPLVRWLVVLWAQLSYPARPLLLSSRYRLVYEFNSIHSLSLLSRSLVAKCKNILLSFLVKLLGSFQINSATHFKDHPPTHSVKD